MIIEVDYFEEFLPEWWSGEKNRHGITLRKMTINTKYVAWMRRCSLGEGDIIEMTEVHFADRGQMFRIDKTYEEMKAIVGEGQ